MKCEEVVKNAQMWSMLPFPYLEEAFILDDPTFQWYVPVMARLPWNEALREITWEEPSFLEEVFAYRCYDLFTDYFVLDERQLCNHSFFWFI